MDDEVEAVCRAWYGHKWDHADPRERPGEKMKDVWRDYARRAIKAIRDMDARRG